jgi:hypothetical protein
MLNYLKKLFGFGTSETAPEAPYKVETPVQAGPAKCGCGRSQTGNCVGLHKLTPEEWAVHADNPNATKAPAAAMTAKPKKAKAPAKPKAEKTAKPKAPKKPKMTVAK